MSVLDRVDPPAPAGLTIQVTRSVADQVVVENLTSDPLEVLGEDRRPFLRIGPAGVEADTSSADWFRSNAPEGAFAVPDTAGAGRPPTWELVSKDRFWGWFDHRLHPSGLTTAPQAEPGETVVLDEWEIPMRLGGEPLRVIGRRLFARPAGYFRNAIVEQIPGAEAAVLDGKVPAVFLRLVDPSRELTLIGASGQPFARLSAAGTEVNEANRTWMLTARSRGAFDPETPIGGEPRWRTESSAPQLTWLEPRAIPKRDGVDFEWIVPGGLGGESVALRGRSVWVPATHQDRAGLFDDWRPVVATGAALAAVAIIASVVRVRRRAQPTAPHGGG